MEFLQKGAMLLTVLGLPMLVSGSAASNAWDGPWDGCQVRFSDLNWKVIQDFDPEKKYDGFLVLEEPDLRNESLKQIYQRKRKIYEELRWGTGKVRKSECKLL